MLRLTTLALASVAGVALSLGSIGCQPERPDVVPSSAQMWSSGNGMMHYEAPADGTVYIYDHTAQRLLWSGHVTRGESVDVNPQRGEIQAGGNTVVNKLAAPGDQKDIYFDPAPTPSPAPTEAPGSSGAWNTGRTTSGGVLVTPNVTVQPSGQAPNADNNVQVQPAR